MNGRWEGPKCLHKMPPGYSWEGTFPFLLGPWGWALGGQELGPSEISQGGLARYLSERILSYAKVSG